LAVDAILIAGPTASGKSQVALALAEAIGGAVVNADSMQVYREARILTARPSDDDMARAPHLLYGHVGLQEPYSVGRYQTDAARALADARAAGCVPIFTGGTGLYFGALTEGLANIPPIPVAIRDAARARRETIGPEAFHGELAARDRESAAKLKAGDTQRTLRAYEVFEATGRPLSAWQREMGRPVLDRLRLARFVLSPPRAVLHERIAARFDAMLAEGAIEEAAALAGLDPALPAAKILGRRELLAVRAGTLTPEEAVTRAKVATRQYAKRQVTWFRHRMGDWNWLESQESSNILPYILARIA
jgi:tRNA dimethylallyltransferase